MYEVVPEGVDNKGFEVVSRSLILLLLLLLRRKEVVEEDITMPESPPSLWTSGTVSVSHPPIHEAREKSALVKTLFI